MYCTPLEVHDQADTLVNARESTTDQTYSSPEVDGGTITLDNNYLIENAFTSSEYSDQNDDQDIRLFIDSSLVDPGEYNVNLRDGVIEETGTAITDGSDYEIRYKHSDIPNEVVVSAIENATEHIDNKTNTTFDGTVTRTDEIYDGEGGRTREYQFEAQPVQSVADVSVNQASLGNPDDWKAVTEGRAND